MPDQMRSSQSLGYNLDVATIADCSDDIPAKGSDGVPRPKTVAPQIRTNHRSSPPRQVYASAHDDTARLSWSGGAR
jgi:hypothetical protein